MGSLPVTPVISDTGEIPLEKSLKKWSAMFACPVCPLLGRRANLNMWN